MASNIEFMAPISKLREQIFAAYRMDENQCVRDLLKQVQLSKEQRQNIWQLSQNLIQHIRATDSMRAPFKALMAEYDLSSAEGVALMCLAEAILRIPDKDTIEKLIADKISHADWSRHLHKSKSKFVNSTTWSLLLTGKVLNLNGVVPSLIKRCGEPIVRQAVTKAVIMLCKQFVLGQSITEGLQNALPWQQKGYRFSYDMLGEEARTAEDAHAYYLRYMEAIEAAGKSAHTTDVYKNPGISIKLSALHPRFEWRKRARVLQELLPRVISLAKAARQYNLGFTIDAEEAERLDLSLDIFTALCKDPHFANWPGLGFAVQCYQKRATYVITYLIDLARTSQLRINLRLVKGAYWDMEIKLAQEKGLSGYPVFTRKASTDLAFIVCAKQMLAAPDAIFAQFATHNAYAVATVFELAKDYRDFEFQALFGMGEELYAYVLQEYAVPCRIYAPVGHYNYLFGYLIRRLLENGANTSFVNRLPHDEIPIDELIVDPIATLQELQEYTHPKIPLPKDLYADRPNSRGVDFTNPQDYTPILETIQTLAKITSIKPLATTTPEQLQKVITHAVRASHIWNQSDLQLRLNCVHKMAELLEEHKAELIALLVQEGYKTILDALAEVREAIDYCWYYALRASIDLLPQNLPGPTGESNQLHLHARGIIVCISPWNFPLAIFLGQVLAALLAGNAVIAKPARQTPNIARRALELLYAAGVPKEVVQLVIGSGAEVGDPLTNDLRTNGVMLTGSTVTAKHINAILAAREGPIVPFIAETGGQNVMLVDSSALPEQVVADVITSAFGSAGQRCSCLRVLYIQNDIADIVIKMLCGAMAELSVGNPASLATDVGPVIDAESYQKLLTHKHNLTQTAKFLYEVPVSAAMQAQNYFAPCLFEIQSISELHEETFGPVLHVIRFDADRLGHMLTEINATGYGLTLGIHSRIDDTINYIISHVKVGNIYVNRNMIGAVVGVQPFGGEGLSGTGPKAGGPHYIPRLTVERCLTVNTAAVGGNASLLTMVEE